MHPHHKSKEGRDNERDCRDSAYGHLVNEAVCVPPRSTHAGSWKHKLLPKEVAA